MADNDDAEKSHEPTQKRLDDARARGEIPRSPDLLAALALAAFVGAVIGLGADLMSRSALTATGFLAHPDGLDARDATLGVLYPLLPLLLLPGLAVVSALVAQRGFVFTPENVAPKLSRIDPFAAAARRFGAEGLADFIKGVLKLVLVGGLLAWFALGRADGILGSPALADGPAILLVMDVLIGFLASCLAVSLALGLGDLLWQTFRHRVRNRMSRQDLVDEHRESEGDPQARAERRQRGQEIAMNRMMADIPRADLVIVNPTHYAVALQWTRASGRAPVCVAKGLDAIALRIRAAAVEHGVPVHSDPPTARAIHATVEIGQSIRPEHYRAVAAALRLTDAMRRKTKRMK